MLVAQSFRTPAEAIALANNSRYGLAAGVWTENIGLATDVALSIKAGTIWVNCHNQFDAAAGFGGSTEPRRGGAVRFAGRDRSILPQPLAAAIFLLVLRRLLAAGRCLEALPPRSARGSLRSELRGPPHAPPLLQRFA